MSSLVRVLDSLSFANSSRYEDWAGADPEEDVNVTMVCERHREKLFLDLEKKVKGSQPVLNLKSLRQGGYGECLVPREQQRFFIAEAGQLEPSES